MPPFTYLFYSLWAFELFLVEAIEKKVSVMCIYFDAIV